MARRRRARAAIPWSLLASVAIHGGILAGFFVHSSGRREPATIAFRTGEQSVEIRLVPPPTPPPEEPVDSPSLEAEELAAEGILERIELLESPPEPMELDLLLLELSPLEPVIPAGVPRGDPPPVASPPHPEPAVPELRPVRIEVEPPPAPAVESPPTLEPAEPARSTEGARTAATLTRRIQPRYPRSCRRAGHEGAVLLEVDVDATGRVDGVRVVRTAGCPKLDAAAIAAVREARFVPARTGGLPVASTVRLPVHFVLR